jgi:ribosomal protein S18 acetylase RimI-like enzyme
METSRCLEPVPWETRNLGVESFAVSAAFVTAPDEAVLRKSLEDLRSAHGRFFVQARFRPDTRISRILEANGFYFVETTLGPSVALSGYDELDRFVADPSSVLPRRYERSSLDVRAVAGSDLAMVEEIKAIAGTSFVDDRFHVDHNFPGDVADRRFRLWVDDLFRDATVRFHVLLLRTEPIAFMASREGDLLLAAFARSHARVGLGEFFWLTVIDRIRAGGVARVTSLISANNVAALNLYARLNFKFRDPKSTFHLWASG